MTFTTTNTPELQLKHLASMANSLARRLEIAKAQNNEYLTQLLEREYAELIAESQSVRSLASELPLIRAAKAWFQRQWQNLADTVPNLYQLHVQQIVAEDGQLRWLAYYPKTGQTFCTDSETEMRLWVQKHYWCV